MATTEQNYSTIVFSPLEQFEVRNLLSFDAPILGDINLSITNIGLYLTIGALIVLTLNILATNYNKIGSNNWSISNESLYATIHSIVVNQINETRGQIYFPFIYTLFIFILINNLIGMVCSRCLYTAKFLIIRQKLQKVYFSCNNDQSNLLQPYFVTGFSDLTYRGVFIREFSSSSDRVKDKKALQQISQNTSLVVLKKRVKIINKFHSQTRLLHTKLNANWVTGFSDAEGSFITIIRKNPKLKTGWNIETKFQISLHEKDRAILEEIKLYFGGKGNIYKQGKDSIQYRISSLQDLINVIIPHFDKYPLITQKLADYLLWKELVNLMEKKEHLTIEGVQKIINLKASVNKGLTDELKIAFPKTIPIQRPLVVNQIIRDPYFTSWVYS